MRSTSGFRPGDLVQVRPWIDVVSTLDANGALQRLPFMPEMARFCGRTFAVSRRIEIACGELEGRMRKMADIVYLEDLRCDGSAHGGCQKRCGLLWKEAWLWKADASDRGTVEQQAPDPEAFPYRQVSPEGRYTCQATELNAASEELQWRDAATIARGLRARSASPFDLAGTLAANLSLRLVCAIRGTPFRHPRGRLTRTPREALRLQAGEFVRVKALARIMETLDREGRNRGLRFNMPMREFCGRTFQVLGRLDRMIDERHGRMVQIEDTVLLTDVRCDGRHVLRGGCPRANYYYWREIWLERVPPLASGHSQHTNEAIGDQPGGSGAPDAVPPAASA